MNTNKTVCNNCYIGSLRSGQATLSRWHAGQLIVLPGVSVGRCDFCGEIFYDQDALDRLALLLGSEFKKDRRYGRAAGLDGNWEVSLGRRRV